MYRGQQAHDRMAELERESLAKLAELETELGALKVEYADAVEARRLAEEELTALKRQKQDSARRQSVLENKIIELETLTGTLTKGSSGMRHIYLYFVYETVYLWEFNNILNNSQSSEWIGNEPSQQFG